MFPVPAKNRLRSIARVRAGQESLAERVREWAGRLVEMKEKRVPVRDLYSGDHWFVARTLPELGAEKNFAIQLWVCSAGYGLVPLDNRVVPYSATFTSSNPDSVQRLARATDGESLSSWWRELAKHRKLSPGHPRSLRQLAEASPGTPLVVAASPKYIDAMTPDMEAAREALRSKEYLSIFCAGSRSLDSLEDNRIPCDARLQAAVSGARFSLSVRAVRWAIERKSSFRCSDLQRQFERLLARQPDVPTYDRKPLSDEQVRQFVRSRLRKNDALSRTALLRELRDDRGRACEQSRFGSLYTEVYVELNHSQQELSLG